MARITTPLSDAEIKRTKADPNVNQKLSDGGGLYLLIEKSGSKKWRLDYYRPITKKRNTLAFGIYPEVSLLEARAKRDEAKKLLASDIDPSEQKKVDVREAKLSASNTFHHVAMEWLPKQNYAESTLDKAHYLLELPFLIFGKRPIAEILPIEVLDVCRIAEKNGHLEKARKTMNKCSQVFRYGVAIGACKFDPTRDLKGSLETPVTVHHAALTEPTDVGLLLNDIDHYTGKFVTVCALKLAPLLFTRPGELRKLEWAKLNLVTAQWRYTPPKTQKTTGVEMIVPLAAQVIDILKKLHPITGHTKYVFPANHTSLKTMSENTVNQALRRMGWESEEVCGHGFRATARTILEEELNYPYELIEMQLGHKVRDSNGRAYNRTWKIKLRTEMMQAWADYLDDLRIKAR